MPMNLSDLRKCDNCDGALVSKGSIQFYVIEFDHAILKPGAVNQTLGLSQMFGGRLGLAEVFQPEAPVALLSEHGAPKDKAFICFDCWTSPLMLCSLQEKVAERRAETERKAEPPRGEERGDHTSGRHKRLPEGDPVAVRAEDDGD